MLWSQTVDLWVTGWTSRAAAVSEVNLFSFYIFQFAQATLRTRVATTVTVATEFWGLEDVAAAKASEEFPAICVLLVFTAPTAQVVPSQREMG